jgi:hypothetical protein
MPVDVQFVEISVDLGAKVFTIEGWNDPTGEKINCRHEGSAAPEDVALLKAFLQRLQDSFPNQSTVPC